MSASPSSPERVEPGEPPSLRWLRRLGLAGFLFFLVKGLLWLTVPAVLVALGVSC